MKTWGGSAEAQRWFAAAETGAENETTGLLQPVAPKKLLLQRQRRKKRHSGYNLNNTVREPHLDNLPASKGMQGVVIGLGGSLV